MTSDTFIILLYHGISEKTSQGIQNCSLKHISGKDFETQMEHLAKNYNILSLRDILNRRSSGKPLPSRPVAITFDDGFENNYSVAYPILKRFNLPATFFVSTGFIGTDRTFWVDKVEYLLNESPRSTIHLSTLGRTYPLGNGEDRRLALEGIKKILKSTPGLLSPALEELEGICDVPLKYDYADYRTMDWDQIREMHHSGLCDFGSHTVDHVILSHLSKEQKESQIRRSKADLEKELDMEISLFSYPEGQREHYDEETISLLQDAGFEASPSALFGVNDTETSVFHLYRNMVGFTAPFEKCLEVTDAARR